MTLKSLRTTAIYHHAVRYHCYLTAWFHTPKLRKLLERKKKCIISLDSASLEIARNQSALSLITPPASVLFKSCGCDHSALCHN